MTAAGGLLAIALAAPVAASAAGRIAIDHAPVDCVPYDRYARIVATGAPADGVATAHLQFRAGGDGGWYSVGMAAEGTAWSAFLPRPIRPLARLEYRIVMRSSDAGEAATPAISVRVGGDAAECAGPQSSAEVAAPIVVRAPRGAPLVPPVPAGFSPAGVVAAEDPVRSSRLKTAAVGAGLAGGIAGTVLLRDDEALPLADLLGSTQFAFSGMAPAPGSVLSFSRDQVSVFVAVTGRVPAPFTISWNFDLIGVGGGVVCAFMGGRTRVTSATPTTATLTGPLLPLGACGERFDVDRARLRVTLSTRVLIQEIPATFHFEP